MIKVTNPLLETTREVETIVVKEPTKAIVIEMPVEKIVEKKISVPFDVHHYHENPINWALAFGYVIFALAYYYILTIV